MSIRVGPDGKYYYTTSTDKYYATYDWGKGPSDGMIWTKMEYPKESLYEFDYSEFDVDLGASEYKWYNLGRTKKKKNHLLEDDLFEI